MPFPLWHVSAYISLCVEIFFDEGSWDSLLSVSIFCQHEGKAGNECGNTEFEGEEVERWGGIVYTSDGLCLMAIKFKN